MACKHCDKWIKDPIAYNGIFFGMCTNDFKVYPEYHDCINMGYQ